jgi:hypothetical protein
MAWTGILQMVKLLISAVEPVARLLDVLSRIR